MRETYLCYLKKHYNKVSALWNVIIKTDNRMPCRIDSFVIDVKPKNLSNTSPACANHSLVQDIPCEAMLMTYKAAKACGKQNGYNLAHISLGCCAVSTNGTSTGSGMYHTGVM